MLKYFCFLSLSFSHPIIYIYTYIYYHTVSIFVVLWIKSYKKKTKENIALIIIICFISKIFILYIKFFFQKTQTKYIIIINYNSVVVVCFKLDDALIIYLYIFTVNIYITNIYGYVKIKIFCSFFFCWWNILLILYLF